MSVFKNGIGRPSNEVKNKRRKIIVLGIVLLIMIVYIISSQVNKTLVKNNSKTNKTKDVYIREKTEEEKASEEYVKDFVASDGFYEKYFQDYKVMKSMNNLDNVLIVTSKEEIDNKYGATYMVKAPDYAYFLQYNNESERDNAYQEFSKLKEEGRIHSVDKNSKINLYDNNESHDVEYLKIWPTTIMGFDKANEYLTNNPKNNSIKIGILDYFPVRVDGYDTFYKTKINQDRSINTYYELNSYHKYEHGINVASTIDKVLPSYFGFEQYDLKNSTDFIEQIDILSSIDGVHVINCSFGFEGNSNENVFKENEYNAINRALKKGVIVVAAAGNQENKDINYPSAYTNVISVSSVNIDYKHENNYSDSIDFVAPDYSNCETFDGFARCYGTSFSSPLVASAVAIMKYYDPEIGLDEVKKLLSLYAITDLDGFEQGKNGWGNGLVYVGATKIFEDVKNKDYESGPIEGTIPNKILIEKEQEKYEKKGIEKFINEMKKIFNFYKQFIVDVFSGKYSLIDSCGNSDIEDKKQPNYEKPSNLVASGNYYLISNYENTQNMKKLKDYVCDARSDCYAKAYYMKLSNKIPGVIYYGHCDKGTSVASSCRDDNNKIKYVCNYTCPNPRLATGNLDDAYKNVMANKPSIITLTNGSESHDVVIVGIKKKSYNTLGDSIDKEEAVSLNDLIVIDTWDNTVKEINANSSDSSKNIKGIGTGWTTDYQIRY